MIRRFLAKRRANKRRWAVQVIRHFINGFMKRNEPLNSANEKFLGFVRFHYLMRLTKKLPESIMDKSWSDAPASCQEVSVTSYCFDSIVRVNYKIELYNVGQ